MADHHSEGKQLLEQLADELELGPTGDHPDGKLSDDDDGALRFAITNIGGQVVLHFGTRVEWIGFPPEQARIIAQSIIDNAEEAEQG